MSVVELENVSIRYILGDFKDIGLKEYLVRKIQGNYHIREFWAVDNVSFSLEKGDLLGIIGSNGAGKSTLLKAVTGIMVPTKGNVCVKGSIAALLELGSGFDGDLTVKENTYLRGAMLGYTRDFMDKMYHQILSFAELEDFQDRPFKQLSSGMKSRLAFSIACLVNPDILILDEVLSVGDGAFRKKSEEKMRQILNSGVTAILVSHSLDQIRRMCNKVLWLEKGKQVAFGDTKEICDKYEKFLADKRKPSSISDKGKGPGQQTAVQKQRGIRDQVKSMVSLWDSFTERKKHLLYVLAFSLIFLTTAYFVFSAYRISDRSLIWNLDGRATHYPYLVYLGQYYRDLIGSLFSNASPPMYDLHLGMGMDISGNLVGVGDPLMLLSALVPGEMAELLYDFLVVLRFYLAGLAFSAYCFRMRRTCFPTLIGALAYAFCGFALFSGVRHPYFLNPLIYMPLLLIGLEKVLHKENPLLFIFTVFLAVSTYYYFFYMMSIFIFIYAMFRFFALHPKTQRLKAFGGIFCKAVFFYCTGVLMAGAVLLPMVVNFLSSGRTESGYEANLLFYQPSQYILKIIRFIAAPSSWDYPTMTVLALPSVVYLFYQKDKRMKMIRNGFLVLALFLMIPFFGYALNGFGYISNRWTFAFDFIIAYAIVAVLPGLLNAPPRMQKGIFFISLLYTAICFSGKNITVYNMAASVLLFIFEIILIYVSRKQGEGTKKPQIKRAVLAICMLFVCMNTILNANFLYGKDFSKYSESFLKNGTVEQISREAPILQRPDNEDVSFYRVDAVDMGQYNANVSMLYPVYGLSTYCSTISSEYQDWLSEMEVVSRSQNVIEGYDGRTALNALASVKYFITSAEKNACVPFGYQLAGEKKNKDTVYQAYVNEHDLPIGYTYDACVPESISRALDAVQQQEMMLQAVIVEQVPNGFTQLAPDLESQKMPVSIEKFDGVQWKDGKLKVTKKNGSITLSFKGMKNSETYVRLRDFDITPPEQYSCNINVSGELVDKLTGAQSKTNNYYFGRENYLFNLGYSENSQNYCKISFSSKGTYTLQDIEIYCMPMNHYAAQVDRLKNGSTQNFEIGTNTITGEVNASSDKILCLSVPYSKGWSAYIDGNHVPVMKANYMFMALPLKEGNHTVELKYHTPGLRLGTVMSVAGFAIFIVVAIIIFRRRMIERNALHYSEMQK